MGAARALEIYRDEIHRVLALLGVNSLAELGPEFLLFAEAPLRVPSRRRTADVRTTAELRAVAE
jgi:isopentenyl diphosphate isomerase/L-lactate dehydrogenase-like FMN-dependent dehydrogenase